MKLLGDTSDYWSFIGFGDVSIGAKFKLYKNKSLLIKAFLPTGINLSFLWGIPSAPKNELFTLGLHLFKSGFVSLYSLGLTVSTHIPLSPKFIISPTLGSSYQLTAPTFLKSKYPEYQFFAGVGFD